MPTWMDPTQWYCAMPTGSQDMDQFPGSDIFMHGSHPMVLFDSCSQDMDQFPGSDIFMCEYVYDESFKVRNPAWWWWGGAGPPRPEGERATDRDDALAM